MKYMFNVSKRQPCVLSLQVPIMLSALCPLHVPEAQPVSASSDVIWV